MDSAGPCLDGQVSVDHPLKTEADLARPADRGEVVADVKAGVLSAIDVPLVGEVGAEERKRPITIC